MRSPNGRELLASHADCPFGRKPREPPSTSIVERGLPLSAGALETVRTLECVRKEAFGKVNSVPHEQGAAGPARPVATWLELVPRLLGPRSGRKLVRD